MIIHNLIYFIKVFLKIGNLQEFCEHKNVTTSYCKDTFCPDCGALVDVIWQVAKCSCCNTKRKTVKLWHTVIPEAKYCKNCGSSEFYIDEIEISTFSDFKDAILNKVLVTQNELMENYTEVQAWCSSHTQEISHDHRKLVPALIH